MESTAALQFLKKQKTSTDLYFKKPKLFPTKSSKRNNKQNCSFELPVLCLKRSNYVLPNRQDIYSYSIYNNSNKKDLTSSYDSRDYRGDENEYEKDMTSSLATFATNVQTKSINNFSKVVVTLQLKKDTSVKNKFHSDEHLPLLKTAINNYNNDYNVNTPRKSNNIYSYYDNNNNNNNNSKTDDDEYYEKKGILSSNIICSEPGSAYQIDDSEEDNDYTNRPKFYKEKSFAWTNFEKVLNKRVPENPPATPTFHSFRQN